jgi:Protein of unknown function (DUF642)/PEP-CTERM motif
MTKVSKLNLIIFLCAFLYASYGSLMLPTANANIIDSTYGVGAGSFELGGFVDAGSGYMWVKPGETTITGWTVYGPGDGVDWLRGPWGAADGISSVDLQHVTASSIATVIPTIAGNVYELSFSAANLFGYTNTGEVSAGSLLNQAFTPAVSGYPQTFIPFSFLFTATGPVTSITFKSTIDTTYGPAIDNVNVDLHNVPEPSTMLLLGLGLVGLTGARRKFKK